MGLIALLVAALFAGALALGQSGGDGSSPAATAPEAAEPAGPVLETNPDSGAAPSVAGAPVSIPLPKLAHPKPTPTAKAPTTTSPTTPVAPPPTTVVPVTPPPPPPSGGGGGGGTIISG